MVHSQGGDFGFNAALNAPDKVKVVVAIEPSGAPDPSKAPIAKLTDVPHLFVWGDYMNRQELWVRLLPNLTRYRDGLQAAGVPVEWLDLPKRGIAGNTHMLMMDTNSDQVAGLIQEWLARQGLMN